MMRYQVLLLFVLCVVPLHSQWDANGHVQLKLRSYTDVVDEGRSIFSSRVVVDQYDRIVAVRLGRRVPDSVFSIVLERVMPNGEHDQSFGDQGIAVIPFGYVMHERLHGVFLDSLGAIVVVGNVGQTPFFARIASNGMLDRNYGSNGFVWLDSSFTCGKENGVATGHNVSLACSKVIDDTTTRCLLVNVSDLGIVSYEPYISSRCDRFLVYHHGEQFLASGRTIVKLDTNGLIDTTFGSFGSVRWRHLGGDAFTEDMELYDDSTIVVLTDEYVTRSSQQEECEYMVRYYNVHSGKQLDSVLIPFGYFDDPLLALFYLVVGRDGSLSVGGSYRGNQTRTFPTVFRYNDRSLPDATFYGTGHYNFSLPFGASLLDLSVMSTSQLVAFVTPSFIARLGDPITSVHQDLPDQQFTIVPNPAKNHFTIRAQFPCSFLRYEIFSAIGEAVQDGLTGSDGGVTIDGCVTRGMYCVRVHRSPNVVIGSILSLK